MNSFSSMRTPATLRITALAAALTGLTACSGLGELTSGDKVDYKSSASKPTAALDVPPDLTQLSREARFNVPGAPVSATRFEANQATAAQVAVPTASNSLGDSRIERAGNQRWLVVKRPADKLWDPVREFWQESGFALNIEDQKLGILETEFAENRAKLPQDLIRRTLGRVLDSVYSTGERDKFRTRLERAADGSTEIYISHRGMVETVQGNSISPGSTLWQPRPSDPELETEFLRRLMIKLGTTQAQAQASTASATSRPPVAQVSTSGNQAVVEVAEAFDRAWRRVGLSLDRTGFTVEDRDRTQGIYFVRYVDPNTDQKDKGFFSKLFSSNAPAAPLKYRIALRSQGNRTTVSVLDDKGQPDTSANAKRIVQVIADDLK